MLNDDYFEKFSRLSHYNKSREREEARMKSGQEERKEIRRKLSVGQIFL